MGERQRRIARWCQECGGLGVMEEQRQDQCEWRHHYNILDGLLPDRRRRLRRRLVGRWRNRLWFVPTSDGLLPPPPPVSLDLLLGRKQRIGAGLGLTQRIMLLSHYLSLGNTN